MKVREPELVIGETVTENSAGALNPTEVTYDNAGISADTRDLNVGVVALPVAGPASTKLADSLANVAVKLPELVIGDTVTLNILGKLNPTLLT